MLLQYRLLRARNILFFLFATQIKAKSKKNRHKHYNGLNNIFASKLTKVSMSTCASASIIEFTDTDSEGVCDVDDNCQKKTIKKNIHQLCIKKQKKNDFLLNTQKHNSTNLQECKNCLQELCSYLHLGHDCRKMACVFFDAALEQQLCRIHCKPIHSAFVLSLEHATIIASIALSCKWYGKNNAMQGELTVALYEQAITWHFHCLEDHYIFSTIWTAMQLCMSKQTSILPLDGNNLFKFQNQVASVKAQKAKILHWQNIAYVEKCLLRFHGYNLCRLAWNLNGF